MEKYLGESIPKLGFGLMRLPRNGEEIDVVQVSRMVDLFLERGFRYFDTSWGYPGSEEAAKTALFDRYPRESFVFATKCPVWAAKDREEAREMLNVSLERTGAGYIDFYLLHNLGDDRIRFFDEYDMWDLVSRKKREGVLKHIGFSFHDKAEVLDRVLTEHPEMEFVQLQINYADWEDRNVEARKCWETARKHGKSVVIMEPVKGGTLTHLPPEAAQVLREADPDLSPAQWAIRFAASLEGVVTVLSGMSDIAQMEENTSFMRAFELLNEKQQEALAKVRGILQSMTTVPCTGCRYCVPGCPKQIPIPTVFEGMNLYGIYGDKEGAAHGYGFQVNRRGAGRASECVECGACEAVCPQHIEIRERLREAAEIFDA
ncbi:MAG: aldo/keto reductase [Lachnospiraceae bacterium]|nr:aldo/keto reductase [Lachnospiraceae bacterium]